MATLGLGLVLGPEGPLIALGLGLGSDRDALVKRDAPEQAVGLMAAAGSFAAVSSIFGSPVIGAVLIIEATGLGGANSAARAPARSPRRRGRLARLHRSRLVLGLQYRRLVLSPFPLPPFGGPGWGDFALDDRAGRRDGRVVFAIMELARWAKQVVDRHPFLLTVAAGLAVGGLAIAFAEATGKSPDAVLFSGQESFGSLFGQAATISLSTLTLLLLFKGLAWSISLGNFRGGPTFPAIFLGVVAGLMAQHLPGYAETQAVAALIGAACVSVLRLPLSSVMIASLLCAKAGLAVAPLIVVAVVVAYLTSETLTAFVDARIGADRGRSAADAAQAAPLPAR